MFERYQGIVTALVVAFVYAHFLLSVKPLGVRALALLEALAIGEVTPEELRAGTAEAQRQVDDAIGPTVTAAAGLAPAVLRVLKGGAAPLLVLACLGCVQVAITTDRSKAAPQRQDVARTTSSTQTAEAAVDVPVSLIPK
jgi:hypothetical protein